MVHNLHEDVDAILESITNLRFSHSTAMPKTHTSYNSYPRHEHAQSAEGSLVGLGAAVPHAVDGDSLVYEATATRNVSVEGIAAQESTMATSVLNGEALITVGQ